MRMQIWKLAQILGVCSIASLTSCTSPKTLDRTNPGATLDQLAGWMEGSFSNHQQAGLHPEFPETLLHIVRIWPTIEEGAWFYFEEIPTASGAPIRQQIRHITQIAPGTFAFEVYSLPENAATWTGAWAEPARFAELKIDQLDNRDGCTLTLTSSADGAYDGSTDGTSCKSELSGAAYATTRVRIDAQGLAVWEKCFDEHGKPVGNSGVSSARGPLRFERLESSTADSVRSGGA
jgi:hypothetical protein